jgi:hypothetical protein
MTFKEALSEASRRMGWTEEQIAKAMQQASLVVPMPKEMLYHEIPPDKAEELVQRLVSVLKKVDAHFDHAEKMLNQRLRNLSSNN